jgi:glycine/D-amino acid oxidase-like deaminating enzyme
MPDRPRIAVVGCGIFGAEVALQAADTGFEVLVFERADVVLAGASRNNQNRLHQGFHYPRDLDTGLQSIRGYHRFVARYPECVDGDFPNAYFIADQGSMTSPDDYLAFCERLGMPHTPILARDFAPMQVLGASTGVLCGEAVYDCAQLRASVASRLGRSNATLRTVTAVTSVEQRGEGMRVHLSGGASVDVDAVVNCSYADINRLTGQLGHPTPEREYEYTAVPIIALDVPRAGVTIMDGPFMTLLPYGKSRDFLLYDVVHTVIAREVAQQLDPRWLDPASAPFAGADRQRFFADMVASCQRYLPVLAQARMVGCLEGPRMVLARNHATDARPSLVNGYGDRYYTVFSGKVDHCVWVAEDVCGRLLAAFGDAPVAQ